MHSNSNNTMNAPPSSSSSAHLPISQFTLDAFPPLHPSNNNSTSLTPLDNVNSSLDPFLPNFIQNIDANAMATNLNGAASFPFDADVTPEARNQIAMLTQKTDEFHQHLHQFIHGHLPRLPPTQGLLNELSFDFNGNNRHHPNRRNHRHQHRQQQQQQQHENDVKMDDALPGLDHSQQQQQRQQDAESDTKTQESQRVESLTAELQVLRGRCDALANERDTWRGQYRQLKLQYDVLAATAMATATAETATTRITNDVRVPGTMTTATMATTATTTAAGVPAAAAAVAQRVPGTTTMATTATTTAAPLQFVDCGRFRMTAQTFTLKRAKVADYNSEQWKVEAAPPLEHYFDSVMTFLEENDENALTPFVSVGAGAMPQADVVERFKIERHSRISALNGQFGLRAKIAIPNETVLGQYLGDEYLESEFAALFRAGSENTGVEHVDRTRYAFTCAVSTNPSCNSSPKMVIDAHALAMQNCLLVCDINDCRKHGKLPRTAEDMQCENVEFAKICLNGWPCVFVISKRDIARGEELVGFYGDEYFTQRMATKTTATVPVTAGFATHAHMNGGGAGAHV